MEIKTDIARLTFFSGDLGKEMTIKEFLKKLLLTLWEEGENFSGKRPFGNSGWKYDIYKCLIKNNVVNGKLDEDDYVDECDSDNADEIIKQIIQNL